jgi:hypothetical protein
MSKHKIAIFISALFIIIFLYTAINKLLYYEQFKIEMKQSPILKRWAGWVSWVLPIVELLTAIMLLVANKRVVGFYLSFALMIIFTIYLIKLTYFSYYIPCSCGGILSRIPADIHIVFNTILSMLALLGIFLEKMQKKRIQ